MNNTLRWLGYAGLIPFIALPAFIGTIEHATAMPVESLFLIYSAIILGFMAGVIWPVLYTPVVNGQERSGLLALVAVTPPVISFLIIALVPQQALLVQAALFMALRLFEAGSGIDALYASAYRSLRWQLTAVVLFCHLWLWWLL